MAYYTYNNHSIDDQGEFNRDYYYNYSLYSNYSPYNYPLPLQDSIAISYYKNSIDSQIFTYDPIIPSSISYSISSPPSDPNYIPYDPTQFAISYSVSVSDFNETENFDEYDPTPYGGGYNLSLTYGNPLPPSDDICYPRSSSYTESAVSGAAPPAALPSIGVPAAPIAAPPVEAEAESKSTASGNKNDVSSNLTASGRPNDAVEGQESNFGSGRQNGVVEGEESKFGSGAREVGYEVNEMPYGYGLEAMDICEGLFGYWPCVTKCRRRLDDYQQAVDSGNYRNPWDGTADYLFGNPNPYVETRDVDDHNTYGQNFWGS